MYNWVGVVSYTIASNQKVLPGKDAVRNNLFSLDDTPDVGTDEITAVYPWYRGRKKFTGKINNTTIDTCRRE